MKRLYFVMACIISSAHLYSESNLEYLNRILNFSVANIKISDNSSQLEIYDRLANHMKLYDKYMNNITDAISYFKSEESYLDNMMEITGRIRELQLSKSGLLSPDDIKIIDNEIMLLLDEFISILKNANFNSIYYFKDILSQNMLDDFFYGKAFNDIAYTDSVMQYLSNRRSLIGSSIRRLEMSQKNGTLNTSFSSESGEIKKEHLLFLIKIFNIKTN